MGRSSYPTTANIFWNGKSSFANCEHRSNGNGVIASEKRRWTGIRREYLLHRVVAAFKGEIPLGHKGLIERKVRRFKSEAIAFETPVRGYVVQRSVADMGNSLVPERYQVIGNLAAGLIFLC